MRKPLILPALILGLMLLVLPGCSDDKKADSQPASTTSVTGSLVDPPKAAAPATPPAPATPSPQVIQAKWNAYAQIVNFVNGQLEPLLRLYHQAFGESLFFQKPTSKEARDAFANATLNSRQAIELIEQAEKIALVEPQADVDRVATVAMPVMKYLWIILAEMGGYMRAGEYENDEYARADELHTLVLEGTEALNQSLPIFLRLVIDQDAAFRAQAVENMRASGQPVMAAMMDFVNAAKALQDYFLSRGVTEAKAFAKLPAEELTPLCERVEASFKNLEETAGNKETVEKENLHAFSVEEYRQTAKQLQTQSAAFQSNLKKKRAPASGAFDKYNQDVSRLIRRYNAFAQKNAGS